MASKLIQENIAVIAILLRQEQGERGDSKDIELIKLSFLYCGKGGLISIKNLELPQSWGCPINTNHHYNLLLNRVHFFHLSHFSNPLELRLLWWEPWHWAKTPLPGTEQPSISVMCRPQSQPPREPRALGRQAQAQPRSVHSGFLVSPTTLVQPHRTKSH